MGVMLIHIGNRGNFPLTITMTPMTPNLYFFSASNRANLDKSVILGVLGVLGGDIQYDSPECSFTLSKSRLRSYTRLAGCTKEPSFNKLF